MKFDRNANLRIALRSRTFDMTSQFQDGGHDVIYAESAATWWVNTKFCPRAYAAASVSSWSIVPSYCLPRDATQSAVMRLHVVCLSVR